MKFQEIKKESRVSPGEYLLHVPSQEIVLCGSVQRDRGILKVLSKGRVIEDKIENFHKIFLPTSARRQIRARRKCAGCKGS